MVKPSDNIHIDDLVGRAVEDYFQRLRRGERPQLDDLVNQYPEIKGVLETVIPGLQAAEPSSSMPTDDRVTPDTPKQIGDFLILREIGRGGMGVVYEAEQISMQRRIALKVLPLAGLVDELRIRRFQNEVRAVAALEHPNIVSVYMVGEERGVHYYAMQLIRGRSLSEVISSLRRDRDEGEPLDGSSISRVTSRTGLHDGYPADLGAPTELAARASKQLTSPAHVDTIAKADSSTIPHSSYSEYYRGVAELGIQAATALQHAHDQGIIHRDIKPANLLLDGSAQLHLTDFGLARIESDVGVTMTGDMIGTLRYMAPEQALGKRVVLDHRADIYSLAATLYELLTLQPAYLATDRQQLLKQIAFEEPIPLCRIAPDIPVELETIVHKAMSKDVAQRYATAEELADDLRSHLENRPIKAKRPTRFEVIGKWMRRNLILTWAAIITFSLVSLTLATATFFVLAARESLWNERWARRHLLPEIRRLVDQEKFTDAFDLALDMNQRIPEDPTLDKLWPEFSVETSISTDPAGVDVSIREWNALESEWRQIGTTPIRRIRLPKGHFHWKLSKKNHATLVLLRDVTETEMTFSLMKSDVQPPGMVKVKGGNTFVALVGLAHVKPYSVGDYLIDRYEVTNREFKEFVDRGGYASRQYWKHPFAKDDVTLSWEDAMDQFVDSTGKPGPAGWRSGHFPEGQPDHPVRGVSWYEAAAYAEFAGKRLPSVYHWARAADLWGATYVIPRSNFGTEGTATAGHYLGVGGYGTFDMAGNVKEWCSNLAGLGRRYILGGAWNEPEYMFNDPDFQSPFARSETFGFRCAKVLSEDDTSPRVYDEILRIRRDFRKEKPVSDTEFANFKLQFLYDSTSLNEMVLVERESEGYSYEKIKFDAAYGNEQVTAHLYRPFNTVPPYQTVIYFPPANKLIAKHFNSSVLSREIAFLVENGRAVMYPIYKGTFERKNSMRPFQSAVPAATPQYRDHMIAWSNDLGRSIDYLETRPDIAHEKLAYYGYSWGGVLGAILPAVESRLKVAVLSGAGFCEQKPFPAVDQINFASRVTIPTLMLNGRYNTFFPVDSSVKPMFELLGTPDADKQFKTFESAHSIPQKDLTRETVDWLDKYLGPVEWKRE